MPAQVRSLQETILDTFHVVNSAFFLKIFETAILVKKKKNPQIFGF